MAFKVNETLVIQNVNNTIIGQRHHGLFKATIVHVDPDQSEDWTAVKTSETSYCHVAFKEDRGWQVELLCRNIDGTVFPDDVAAVHIVLNNERPRILVVDREGVAYGFPAYGTVSLSDFAFRFVDQAEARGGNYKLANIFHAASDVEGQIAEGVCVYRGGALVQEKELNTVSLSCALSGGVVSTALKSRGSTGSVLVLGTMVAVCSSTVNRLLSCWNPCWNLSKEVNNESD